MQSPPKTVASYLPTLIAHRLAANPTLTIAPKAQSLTTAILFLDITGLIELTEQLIAHGPAGSEELSQQLKDIVGEIVDLLTSHGGDLVKLAADTLVALWPTSTTNEDLATVTLRAVQCGLSLLNRFHNHPLTDTLSLSLKITVLAGDILTVDLGGVYGRWEFLTTGALMAQTNQLKQVTPAGAIILSNAAWTLIEGRCSGQISALDSVRLISVDQPIPLKTLPLPTLSPQAEGAMRGYLSGALLSLLRKTRISLLAELLPVTVLFVNLPSIDDTESPENIQSIIRALQTILYDHEGSVDRVIIDERGTSLTAILGLPPMARWNGDAPFGVQAALAMRQELAQLNLRGAIGITTGRAFCGILGNQRRSDYTVIGKIVNLAQKLAQESYRLRKTEEVVILCDQATYEASQEQIAFEIVSPIVPKNGSDSIPVYRPTHSLLPDKQDIPAQSSDHWLDSDLYANFYPSDS